MMINAVLVDSREPEWVRRLAFGGALKSEAMLDAGDVHVATEDGALLVVERKTSDDLLSSIRDKRLFAQCQRMRAMSPWAYVVVCGMFQCAPNGKVVANRGQTGWNWNAVQGALLSIQELGVFVTFCGGDGEFEGAVMRLAERKRDPLMRVLPVRTPVTVGRALAILSDFPNIGLDRAQALLDGSGSLAWALVALSDGTDLPGIGPVTKRLAKATLGLKDDEELQIIVSEKRGHDVQTSDPVAIAA